MNNYKGQRTKRDLMGSLVEDAIISTVRKTANNTLEYQCENGDRGVQLHDTEIVRINTDGDITLDSGGWETLTTKERINQFLPNRTLYQKDYTWYIWNRKTDETIEFYDGMTIIGGAR